MKHILSAADWDKEFVNDILDRAGEYADALVRGSDPTADNPVRPFATKVINLFVEPSTRTCGSNYEAARLLGYHPEKIEGEAATSLVKKESLSATARMLAGYNASILVMRTAIEGGARWIAEMLERYGFETAVHNGGDGAHAHPTQAMLDAFTIRSRNGGKIGGIRIGFVGDLKNSRVVHSDLQLLRLFPDIEAVLVSAPEVALQPWYLEGLNVVAVSDSLDALKGCDFVYVTRVQRERFASQLEYERVRGRYVVGARTLQMLGSETLIMHPQPIADNEVHPEIWNHPQVIMDEQARNGVPVRMALQHWSVSHLDESGFPEPSPPVIETVELGSIDDGRKRKPQGLQHFIPIDNGTVIDHLPNGSGPRVMKILRINRNGGERQAVILAEGIRSQKLEGGRKSTLALEGWLLGPEEKAAVATLAPGVTFNEFHRGHFTKLKVRSVSCIRRLGTCPNSNCVTARDVEASLHPHFHIVTGVDGQLLECHYCEHNFRENEVFT